MSAASSGTNGIEQTEPAPLMLGRVRSLESSVLYLQQQHAETLRGLHEEIRNLQKRNSEYAFQLAIHNVGSARAELAAVEQERAQLADALVAAERRVDTVEGALEKRDKRVTFLMEQNHALELKMENEARAQKLALRKLELELNKKAQLVAQLTTQLHAMSRLRHQQQHVPSPPSAGTPTGRIPSRHGKLLRCGSAISLASSAALDGDVDSKMTSASAEFLVSAAASGSSGSLHASLGPQHAVLPPISVTSAAARPCMPAKHTSGVAASDSPPSANN